MPVELEILFIANVYLKLSHRPHLLLHPRYYGVRGNGRWSGFVDRLDFVWTGR